MPFVKSFKSFKSVNQFTQGRSDDRRPNSRRRQTTPSELGIRQAFTLATRSCKACSEQPCYATTMCRVCLHASIAFHPNPLSAVFNRASATALKGSEGVCAGTGSYEHVLARSPHGSHSFLFSFFDHELV